MSSSPEHTRDCLWRRAACVVWCVSRGGVVFGVARVRAPQRGANHEHDPTPVSASAMMNKKTDTSTVRWVKRNRSPPCDLCAGFFVGVVGD